MKHQISQDEMNNTIYVHLGETIQKQDINTVLDCLTTNYISPNAPFSLVIDASALKNYPQHLSTYLSLARKLRRAGLQHITLKTDDTFVEFLANVLARTIRVSLDIVPLNASHGHLDSSYV